MQEDGISNFRTEPLWQEIGKYLADPDAVIVDKRCTHKKYFNHTLSSQTSNLRMCTLERGHAPAQSGNWGKSRILTEHARRGTRCSSPERVRGINIEGVFSHQLQNGRQILSAGIENNRLQSRKVNNSITTDLSGPSLSGSGPRAGRCNDATISWS